MHIPEAEAQAQAPAQVPPQQAIPARTMADAWLEAAFLPGLTPTAKEYPPPPDLLVHGGIKRFPKASERHTASGAPDAGASSLKPAVRTPIAPVAWVVPPLHVTPVAPPMPAPEPVDFVAAAEVAAPAYGFETVIPAFAPAPAPSHVTPPIPVDRVKSLMAVARPFEGLDADAYREHIAIKMQALGGEDTIADTAPPPARPRMNPLRIPVALTRGLARGLVAGIKSAGRAAGAAVKKLLGAGKHGATATTSGIKTAAKVTGRGIRKTVAAVVWASRKFATPAIAMLGHPLALAKAVGSWRLRFGTPDGNGIMAAAVPFQPDIDEIIEEPAPHAMRSLHYFIVAMFVLLVVIASLVKVEIIVQGSGQLATETSPIVLQPMERGIIREIKVKVGDVVTKGQVLASLDATFADADVGSLKTQHHALDVALRRIEAEMTSKEFVINEVGDPHEDLQAALFLQRQSQYNARLRAFDEEINRWEANIKATTEDRNFLAQQLQIANDVEAVRTKLWQGKLTSKLQYLDSQNNRLRYQRDYQAAVEKLVELQHNLDGKRAERQAFVDDWRRQLLEDMLNKRTELTKINEQLSKAARLHDMVLLTAPEDGVVLDVVRRSVGSVLREAEPFITMVPSNATLIAEIMVASGDVGYAVPGDRVVVKVDAFPYQRHGMVEGRLISISEESFNPGSRGPNGESSQMPSVSGAQHRARIALTNTKLEKMPETARLIPGMTLSAEIMVGRRSVISYFLYPITRALHESIREP